MTEKISNEIARELLYRMTRIRRVEEAIASRYSEWKMRCPTHLSIGQEAVGTVAGYLLRDADFAVSTHRAHAHYLGKGGDLKRMVAEIYGKETGCSGGRGGSMHLVDQPVGFMGSTAIVGGTIPIGVGLALSSQLKKTNEVSCVYLGDGAVEEGVFYESVNFAVVRNLPVIFVCENNLYSVYSPLEVRQPKGREIHEMVEAMGIRSDHGDGNDIYDIHEKFSIALNNLKNGDGPQFLEFDTYRWREHCGPNFDNDIGYRSVEEFTLWKERDPILRLSKQLVEAGELDANCVVDIEQQCRQEIEEAFHFAETSPFPDVSTMKNGVFANTLYRENT